MSERKAERNEFGEIEEGGKELGRKRKEKEGDRLRVNGKSKREIKGEGGMKREQKWIREKRRMKEKE